MKTDCSKCNHAMTDHEPNETYERLVCKKWLIEHTCDCVLGEPEGYKIIISKWNDPPKSSLFHDQSLLSKLIKSYGEFLKDEKDKNKNP